VVVVALASTVIAFSGFRAVTSSAPSIVGDFLQRHVNLLFLVQVPLLAAWCRIIGLRDRFNCAGFLILAAYTTPRACTSCATCCHRARPSPV